MVTHPSVSIQACPRAAPGRDDLATVGQARWLRAAEDAIDAACFRADARRNVLVIARVIGWSADWLTGRTRPTLARLQEVSGLSRRCVQYWCRWIERQGLLDVLEPGVTPQFRPALLVDGDGGNLAREWRLTIPGEERCTPPVLGFALGGDPEVSSPTRARASTPKSNEDRRSAPGSPPPPPLPSSRPRRPGRNPQRRRNRLAAAEQLRSEHQVLRRMSARALRSALREWSATGWTAADVLFALEQLPGGERVVHEDAVRSPAGWLASRLAHWRGPDGTPLPPHSAELAARADADRAGARSERVRRQRAEPADPTPYAAMVRDQLARLREARRTASDARPASPARTASLPGSPPARPRSSPGRLPRP